MFISQSREVLLKGKDRHSWPPCTNKFRSAPFKNENIIDVFYKTSYLDEEVNRTEPSPSVSFPCPSEASLMDYLHCRWIEGDKACDSDTIVLALATLSVSIGQGK